MKQSFLSIAKLALVVLTIGCGACSGPAGPGNGPNQPSGRIFFQWWPNGAPGWQPWVYHLATGTSERLPVWFDQGVYPHVDTVGTRMVFKAPTGDITTVSLLDSTQIDTWRELGKGRFWPRLSQDGDRLATHRPLPQGSEIWVADLTTRQDRMVAHLDNVYSARPIHWFLGGDSLLVSAFTGSVVYFVIQADGSRTSTFDFAAAAGAFHLAITNDGSKLALGVPIPVGRPVEETDLYRVVTYDLQSRRFLQEFILPHWVGEIAWSPDGRYLVHAPRIDVRRQSTLEIIDVETGARTVIVPAGVDASFLSWTR